MAAAAQRAAAERARFTSKGRLLAALVLVLATALAPLHATPLVAASLVTSSVLAFGRATGRVVRALPPALLFIALTFLPLAAGAGAERAALLALRALLAVTTGIALAGSIPKEELAPALASIGVPGAVAAAVSAALRQTSVLRAEGRRMLLARRLRGRASPLDGAALLGTLLARAAGRAERVELAARLRGYSPDRVVRRMRLTSMDWPLLVLSTLGAVAIHVTGRLFP